MNPVFAANRAVVDKSVDILWPPAGNGHCFAYGQQQ